MNEEGDRMHDGTRADVNIMIIRPLSQEEIGVWNSNLQQFFMSSDLGFRISFGISVILLFFLPPHRISNLKVNGASLKELEHESLMLFMFHTIMSRLASTTVGWESSTQDLRERSKRADSPKWMCCNSHHPECISTVGKRSQWKYSLESMFFSCSKDLLGTRRVLEWHPEWEETKLFTRFCDLGESILWSTQKSWVCIVKNARSKIIMEHKLSNETCKRITMKINKLIFSSRALWNCRASVCSCSTLSSQFMIYENWIQLKRTIEKSHAE